MSDERARSWGPGEFAVGKKRIRDTEVPPPVDGKRYVPPGVEKTPQWLEAKQRLLDLNPNFSCDWESTSVALLNDMYRVQSSKNHESIYNPDGTLKAAVAPAVPVVDQKFKDDVTASIAGMVEIVNTLSREVASVKDSQGALEDALKTIASEISRRRETSRKPKAAKKAGR